MKFKRILSFLLIFVFIISSEVFSAEIIMYHSESFDDADYATGGSRLIAGTQTFYDPGTLPTEFVIEFEASVSFDDADKRVLVFKDAAKRSLELVKFSSGGSIVCLGSACAPYEAGKTYRIGAIVNLTAKTCDISIDGTVLKSGNFTKRYFSYDEIEYLLFSSEKKDDLHIDNIRIYSGNTFAGDASFENAQTAGSLSSDVDFSMYEGTVIMFDESPRAFAKNSKCLTAPGNPGVYPREIDGVHYVPAGFVLSSFGYEVTENAGAFIYTSSEASGEIRANDKTATVNGVKTTLKNAPELIDGTVYVSDEDAEKLTGLTCRTSLYTTVIGEKEKAESIISDEEELNMLYRELMFDIPTQKQLTKNVLKTHPRIMADGETFENIAAYLASGDERINEWAKTVIKNGEDALKLGKAEYKRSDGLRLDNNENVGQINDLLYAFKLTGDERFAKKAAEQLEAICAFQSWNSDAHFLDTAGVMKSVALCYDWMYDYLSEAQKQTVRQAIRDKGLKPALSQYASDAFWVRAEHNWNAVCNSGVACLAIAVIDEPELKDLACDVLAESFKSIRYMIGSFRPDGAWVEGVGYWYYMTRSLVRYMWTLETAYGTTFGIADAPGMAETGYFPAHMVGPNGTFNISEGAPYTYIDAPELLWFARYLNDEGLKKLRYDQMERYGFKGSMVDILLYSPVEEASADSLETDKHYRMIEAAVMQTSWDDPNGVYLGLAGGSNGYNHGHMDVGSFVFDANGVRWAIGLDGDDYNLPGYFAQGEGGQTWDYYRLRAEGHNTLVIDPDSSGGQRVQRTVLSPVVRFETNQSSAIAVTDMTRNYDKISGKQIANSIVRGVRLDKINGVITVQDEIDLKAKEELYWFMHTEAGIEISADGKTAVLKKDGKECTAVLSSPGRAVFTVMAAEPLKTSPNPDGQNKNEGYRKLAVHLADAKQEVITVTFFPYDGADKNVIVQKMSDWKLSDENKTKLTFGGVYADGKLIEGTDKGFMSADYIMERDSEGKCIIPEITCGDATEIIYPDTYPGTVKLVLRDGSIYQIYISDEFVVPTEPVIIPENARRLNIRSVKATAEQEGNGAGNICDGDLNTRWSAEGLQTIEFDLGKEDYVQYARFSFYQGHTRYNIFSIETSVDGVNWTTVYDGQSIESTSDLQAVKLIGSNARYVRYNGSGSTGGTWNSINEAEFYAVGEGE